MCRSNNPFSYCGGLRAKNCRLPNNPSNFLRLSFWKTGKLCILGNTCPSLERLLHPPHRSPSFSSSLLSMRSSGSNQPRALLRMTIYCTCAAIVDIRYFPNSHSRIPSYFCRWYVGAVSLRKAPKYQAKPHHARGV